jgi:hypothetical protein
MGWQGATPCDPPNGGVRQFILEVSLKFFWRPKIFSTLKFL